MAAGTHYPYADHGGGGHLRCCARREAEQIRGDACGMRKLVDLFPSFLLQQLGDKLGHFVVFQEEIFEVLPTQASEGDLSSSLDKYDYEHIRGSRL